jgi:predicted TPR repeat methyltransferase
MQEQAFKLLAPAEALQAALAAHDAGDLDLAETLYGWLLESHPENGAAAHHLGMLAHQSGRHQEALALIRRSIELDGRRPDWHNDLGNMLAEGQQLAPARAAFMASLELDPNHPVVWNNLGAVLQRQEEFDEADYSYRQAIALDPDFIDAMSNLGYLLSIRGKAGESAEYLCRAFVAGATEATPRDLLGIAYNTLGRLDDAREVYRKWLQAAPGHPIATHLYAACTGLDVPARASDAYIEMHFDDLAKDFDAKLVENLDYQAPRLIAEMLAQHAPKGRPLIGLDAGCGTGLCGIEIAPHVDRLTGIDLSSNMLALAERKGVYDEFVKSELTRFMHQRPHAFDLVVIGDTLIYFGPLQEVFDAVRNALCSGGLLVFTVETPASLDAPYGIKPNGRYGHARNYLESLLHAGGFEVLAVLPAAIRIELGRPVNGLVVTARLPVSAGAV